MAKQKKKSRAGKVAKTKPADTMSAAGAGDAAPAEKKKSVSPLEFIRQVRAELRKVTWTSRQETMISTIMVLVMVVIMSLFFFVVDWAARAIIQFILSLG